MDDNGIGKRIRKRRQELNMSQDELAEKLGFSSRSSICKIESNARNLTQQRIKAIADALQTTPDYIMGWSTQPNLIKEIIEKLDDKHSQILLAYAKALLDSQTVNKEN